MQRTPPELTTNARALRRDPTPAKRAVWQALRTHHPRFTRQLVVGHYILDFACRSAKIAVELDGGQHALQVEEDAARTAYLTAQGWTVLRFWNNDVLENLEGVITTIQTTVARASTHPQPLPFREGS
ncbi:endonuclease domain-containing protein [Sphingomonas qomolangmaensis]|uniref:Endonuclease domain-containing protein n=1 Tax=Sphingomonas qomolangmaensis TaxID=2918765 RepID=A0ABY5L4K9_9SPHN|nr:endonuclease domain-containing protein [Sphingomonas qomolangmaensis]UUL81905.1 endonuclease domain-containing protein [Sphingomonas qomolangmaensis]